MASLESDPKAPSPANTTKTVKQAEKENKNFSHKTENKVNERGATLDASPSIKNLRLYCWRITICRQSRKENSNELVILWCKNFSSLSAAVSTAKTRSHIEKPELRLRVFTQHTNCCGGRLNKKLFEFWWTLLEASVAVESWEHIRTHYGSGLMNQKDGERQIECNLSSSIFRQKKYRKFKVR